MEGSNPLVAVARCRTELNTGERDTGGVEIMSERVSESNRQRYHGIRRGFTVVELLVAIAIVSILLAILIPAVQTARDAARRVECVSKLRQIGLATASYHETFQCFPSGNNRGWSLFTSLLPYIDAGAYRDVINFDRPAADHVVSRENAFALPFLLCPADPLASAGSRSERTNYQGNYGTGLHVNGVPSGVFESIRRTNGTTGNVRMKDIVDGASNTVALSEALVGGGSKDPLRKIFQTAIQFSSSAESLRLLAACAEFRKSFGPGDSWRKGGRWWNGNSGYTLYNHSAPPNHVSCTNGGDIATSVDTATSNHLSRGVNVVLCDSSARFISENVDLAVWRAVGTRSGGEIINGF